jgi:hypothetical protein
MKTITHEQLTTMKPAFIAWMEANWCECIDERKNEDPNDPLAHEWETYDKRVVDGHPCHCYGRDEYDSIFAVEIDDDGAIRMPMCDCDDSSKIDPTQRSVIYVPDNDEIYTHYPHITYGGDDYDYYQPIVRWLIATQR